MSDSRLEKFIYAICSMDVSDLPVPLSRIEKLWNCLITGETPDFEPLSRNEKYLMAMLDRYDISNLPAPMSRGEKLLYKIAVGETDLSDVPGYLSRYEELLKYLIENGGISEGDFEYVLYTLNQSLSTLYTTAEKPVKSAILSGNTLVNVKPKTSLSKWGTSSYDSESGICTLNGSNSGIRFNIDLLKTSTKYLVIFDIVELPTFAVESDAPIKLTLGHNSYNYLNINSDELKVGTLIKTITTHNEFTEKISIGNRGEFSTPIKMRFMIIEYQEGIENWDIPYFEGLQSVKMPVLTTTGKNLFDGELELGDIGFNDGIQTQGDFAISKNFNVINGGVNVICSIESSVQGRIYYYDGNKNYISTTLIANLEKTPQNAKYFKLRFNKDFLNSNIMMVYDTSITPYEPFKSNILSTSEDVELRGVGDVEDELDCLTGEVIERTSEAVIDGNESWVLRKTNENTLVFNVEDLGLNSFTDFQNSNTKMISDKFVTGWYENNDKEFICGKANGQGLLIGILKSKLATQDVDGIKQWLSQNPVTIQYQLATESIKTVDLTVVDQDGNVTTLETFDDTTHVLLNSEGLIPTAALTVRTKIPSASSTSLLMDDISTEQQRLNTTVDEQSNNVDATMTATTEIFEEIL